MLGYRNHRLVSQTVIRPLFAFSQAPEIILPTNTIGRYGVHIISSCRFGDKRRVWKIIMGSCSVLVGVEGARLQYIAALF